MLAPERCSSLMVSLLPVKQWTTSDKATVLEDFSPVTRLCQSQATDLRKEFKRITRIKCLHNCTN